MLYWMLNPDTTGTGGRVNADAQVLAGVVRIGAAGKTTTHTVDVLVQPVPSLPVTV